MSLPLLIPALLDFERAPGRYPLIKREPSLLFDLAHTVLLMAAGRAVDGLASLGADQETQARQAARFFVRTALLRSGVDHFTLLGLLPGASAEQVREHYRLMIRLTHPDFAGDGDPWPADAASRINIANDVLSSPDRRADYQASLVPPAVAPIPKPPVSKPQPKAAARPPVVARKPVAGGASGAGWLRRLDALLSTRMKFAIASLGALLSGGALVLLGPTGSETSLAARGPAAAADAARAPSGSPSATAPTLKLSAALEEAPDATSLSGRRPIDAPAPVSAAGAKLALPASAPARDPAARAPGSDTGTGSPAGSPAAASAVAAPAAEPPTALTMNDVHPTLTHVINGLQNGDAAAMAQAIGPEWRQTAANEAFVNQMNQWLAGHHVTQLDNLLFTARPQGQTLVVDGRVEVSSNDAAQQSRQRELHLRAVFKPQDGRPVLTQLAAGQR